MPVLLKHHEIDRWLHGTIQDVIGFQFGEPFDADRMELIRTHERWRSDAPPPSSAPPVQHQLI